MNNEGRLASLATTLTTPEIQSLVKQSFFTNTNYSYTEQLANSKMLFMVKEEQSFDVASTRITELDKELGARRKVEAENAYKLGIATGYSKEIFRNTIAAQRDVSWEEWEGLTVKGLSEIVSEVKADLDYKILLDMTNVLTYCQQTSFTDYSGWDIDISGADTLAPMSTSHTLKYSSITYSNILTGNPTFTQAAYENACNYFTYNVYDNLGQRLNAKPNTIIISYNRKVYNRVKLLVNDATSTNVYSPDGTTLNNNTNANVPAVLNDDMKIMKLAFDIDANNTTDTSKSFWWFIAEIRQETRMSLQWYFAYWWKASVNPRNADYSALKYSFTGYAAYAIGTVNSKKIIASFATA